MLHDLDATLKNVLLAAKAEIPGLLNIADVRFATPDDKFAPDGLLVDLFLLDVVENRELRDVRAVRERVRETIVAHPAPLRVDCTYLVTAWSDATGEARPVHEHRILGEAMLWLSRHPEIPKDMLEGSLRQSMYPPGLSVAHARDDRQAGQFWSALRISPRPAFFLTATIAMDAEQVLDEARRVADVVIRAGVGSAETGPIEAAAPMHIIGGRVLSAAAAPGTDPDARPVTSARVLIQPEGLIRETDADGRYDAGPLSEGPHRLLVRAAGFADTDQEVQIPLTDPDASYDVILRRP